MGGIWIRISRRQDWQRSELASGYSYFRAALLLGRRLRRAPHSLCQGVGASPFGGRWGALAMGLAGTVGLRAYGGEADGLMWEAHAGHVDIIGTWSFRHRYKKF